MSKILRSFSYICLNDKVKDSALAQPLNMWEILHGFKIIYLKILLQALPFDQANRTGEFTYWTGVAKDIYFGNFA